MAHYITTIMIKGGQIDYADYAAKMRKALSGPQICNKDGTLNHSYFNTKKGFYWSQKNTDSLMQGLVRYGLDLNTIRNEVFKGNKSLIELELRVSQMFGVKETSKISATDLTDFRKKHAQHDKK